MDKFSGENKFRMEDWYRSDQFFMAVQMLINVNGAKKYLQPVTNLKEARVVLIRQRQALAQQLAEHDQLALRRRQIHNDLKKS